MEGAVIVRIKLFEIYKFLRNILQLESSEIFKARPKIQNYIFMSLR